MTVDGVRAGLTGVLRGSRALIVVDDVWDSSHAIPFLVGGGKSTALIATRESGVARELSPKASDVYTLDCLSLDESLTLFEHLAPEAVRSCPNECRELAEKLEGLPLALQVAGRMLHEVTEHGDDVPRLVAELDDLTKLFERKAPAAMADFGQFSTPTVAAVFEKSTDRLSPRVRERFALLGDIPPEPASFSLEYLVEYWETDVEDARKTMNELLDRGLCKAVSARHFQVHGVLAALAKSLLED
jgi:hypothetical protein